MQGTRRTPSVKYGPKLRRHAYRPPAEGWVYNSGLCPGQIEASKAGKHTGENTRGEITFGRLLKAQ